MLRQPRIVFRALPKASFPRLKGGRGAKNITSSVVCKYPEEKGQTGRKLKEWKQKTIMERLRRKSAKQEAEADSFALVLNHNLLKRGS